MTPGAWQTYLNLNLNLAMARATAATVGGDASQGSSISSESTAAIAASDS
jgi:hypothetical protein